MHQLIFITNDVAEEKIGSLQYCYMSYVKIKRVCRYHTIQGEQTDVISTDRIFK